jgi:hypothetical protein
MTLKVLILAACLLALLVVLPLWPYSRDWGYWPATIVGIMLVTLTVIGSVRAPVTGEAINGPRSAAGVHPRWPCYGCPVAGRTVRANRGLLD